jgi:hypothetical protein
VALQAQRLLIVTRHARTDVDACLAAMVGRERAGEAMRARPLRVARGAELDDVAARTAIAIGRGFGSVIELAERDAVIARAHRLMALVADVASVARHLGVACAAARAVSLCGLGMIAAKRERVIERALRRRQVIARRE